MGKNGIFVMLLVAVFTLALQPSLVNYSYAGIVVPAEICDDGVDNDGDGFIDLDDPDCHVIILKPVPGALPELPGFPEDPQPLLGDFKCYDAMALHLPEIVLLLDQFQDKQYRILDVERVCNNILKSSGIGPNGEDFPPGDDSILAGQHYKVYNIVDNEFEDDILLQDQWGTTRHTQLTPTELWVPQTKLHSNACPPDTEYNPDTGLCQGTPSCPPPGTFNPTSGTCQVLDICALTAFGAYDSFTDTCNGFPASLACAIAATGYTHIPGTPTCEFIPPLFEFPPEPDWVFHQQTDIHWKCYDVEPKRPDNPFMVNTLDRNFNFEPVPSEVIHLDKICAPVKKSVCMEGYEFTPEGLCQDAIGTPTDAFTPLMFGDNTILDHLTCYDIAPLYPPEFPFFNGENDDVTYVGQFQSDTYTIDRELEICLFATKIHVPETPGNGPGGPQVGGTFIPIDSTSLLLVVAQTTASWMIPVLVSAVGIGIVVARKISSKKE